ncbi:unnamed protein product [Aphis gossypii]|uniref:C2H2-type domain-containing protein n=1 Tax=Aphis gossypii TaxID=80765 RepID=A0A9P0IYC6_APHGO|nr:unnamed protein product [Aphis gossypii]
MYKYKHTLKRHLEGKHGIVDDSVSQKKNVKCELCEKDFGQRKDMLRHIRTIHNNKESEHFNNEVKTTIPNKNTITQSFHNNEYLQSILPDGYKYHVDETKFLENGQFIVRFEEYNFKYDEISSWILQFNQKSKTTYLVTNVRKSELPSVLLKKRYSCHHNTRPKKMQHPVLNILIVNLLFAYKLLKMKQKSRYMTC